MAFRTREKQREKDEKLIPLLEELYLNSRISTQSLEKTLAISRQTISKYKEALSKKLSVYGPTFILNPHALDLQYYFMEIRTNPSEPQILKFFKELGEVRSIDGVLGDYSLIIKLEVQSRKHFAAILNEIDQKIAQSLFQSYRIIETIDIFKMGGFLIKDSDKTSLKYTLDDKKWHLLQILRKNCMPKKWKHDFSHDFFTPKERALLEKINLSRELDKFIKLGYIQEFTMAMAIPRPDFRTKFYVRIKPETIGKYTKLAQELVKNPNIIDLYRTGEDSGLLAVVRVSKLESYQDFIKNLYLNYEIEDTNSTVVVETHLPEVYPPTLYAANRAAGNKIDRKFNFLK